MINFKSINDMKNYILNIEKIYDVVRVIDDNNNCILGDDNEEIKCYHFWNQNNKCKVCLYKSALEQEKPVAKIVNFKSSTFIIKSTAIEVDNKKYVIELIDDMEDRIFFESKYTEFKGDSYIFEINNNISDILRDSLTKLYNRRYIDNRLPSDINQSIKSNNPLSILMIDIDYFKKINDSYGHIIGDEVLKKFASLLESKIESDLKWIGRYGGEEFIVVLPNTNYKNSFKIADRFRKIIEESKFIFDEIEIKITCSIGTYTIKNNLYVDMSTLISYVDKKLYLAKSNGRNRVE